MRDREPAPGRARRHEEAPGLPGASFVVQKTALLAGLVLPARREVADAVALVLERTRRRLEVHPAAVLALLLVARLDDALAERDDVAVDPHVVDEDGLFPVTAAGHCIPARVDHQLDARDGQAAEGRDRSRPGRALRAPRELRGVPAAGFVVPDEVPARVPEVGGAPREGRRRAEIDEDVFGLS